MTNTLSIDQASKHLEKSIDKKIAKIWRGYAGVLFLELGCLHKEEQIFKDPQKNYITEKGDFTIMIEGNWKLIKNEKTLIDIRSTDYPVADKLINKILNLKIIEFKFTKKLRFTKIILQNGYQISICRQPKFGNFAVGTNNSAKWLEFKGNGGITLN